MKRIVLALALGAAAVLAGCDEPQYASSQATDAPPVEAAPSVEDHGAPAAETQAPPVETHADVPPPPSAPKTSEETVKPESETLFY